MTDPGPQGMTMATFVEQVQQRAGLSSQQEADRLVRATMSTLSERVTGGQVDDLSPALPPELRTELTRFTGQATSFDKNTFLDRITGEIDTVDLGEAERQVRAVLSVLRSWAPGREIEDTIAQLPRDLADLFD